MATTNMGRKGKILGTWDRERQGRCHFNIGPVAEQSRKQNINSFWPGDRVISSRERTHEITDPAATTSFAAILVHGGIILFSVLVKGT